ncbi:MAG: succinate--CoA ligase subunit alpha [Nanoarchaeota archaeon]|nr:succinate--CoA ligase subunit alpha [Nanoarchaeota archaeon]
MSILINKDTKLIVQGITGKQGRFHTSLMKKYGTNIVAGVTPGKVGENVEGIPVFNSIKDALKEYEADFSVLFVPARFAKDAAIEAMSNNLNVIIITENIPVHDAIKVMKFAKENNKIVIGPNCPGLITPDECKIGIMPGHIFKKGKIGVVSKSGTLTYEIVNDLTKAGLGQSTAIGIGGDPVIGFDFIKALNLFEKDENTEKIVLIGEIGGDMEERAAAFIKVNVTKPVVAYIGGRTAPKGKKMGHAGAVISGNTGTAESKIKAFNEVGVKVAEIPSQVIEFLK